MSFLTLVLAFSFLVVALLCNRMFCKWRDLIISHLSPGDLDDDENGF